MQTIILYKYKRRGGGITVSPTKPSAKHTEMYRLVADEGKILTDGETVTTCVDTNDVDAWVEIDNAEKVIE